jgi:hypothetical protein
MTAGSLVGVGPPAETCVPASEPEELSLDPELPELPPIPELLLDAATPELLPLPELLLSNPELELLPDADPDPEPPPDPPSESEEEPDESHGAPSFDADPHASVRNSPLARKRIAKCAPIHRTVS